MVQYASMTSSEFSCPQLPRCTQITERTAQAERLHRLTASPIMASAVLGELLVIAFEMGELVEQAPVREKACDNCPRFNAQPTP